MSLFANNRLLPGLQSGLNDLLDTVLAGPRPADVVTALAEPAATLLICELLGIPHADRHVVHEHMSIMVDGRNTIEQHGAAAMAMLGYFDSVRPLDGELDDNQRALTVLLAGYRITSGLIPLGFAGLLANPERLRVWRADPDSIDVERSVDRLLRYCSIMDPESYRLVSADFPDADAHIRWLLRVVYDTISRNAPGLRLVSSAEIQRNEYGGLSYGVHHLFVEW
ncbi:hypothetical protein [Kibdelosporangium aridum]|uniref:hypothetical protein n=1 Tax=Kibdelosporangium aridum TaxID=2030 RepID=UPI000525FE60